MSTLLVSVHPDSDSLTHHLVRQLENSLRPGEVTVADLAAEGFDPRFTLDDRRSYREPGYFPDDVAAEQRRIDAATDLVLVFPVYWWSMPALLKGWIDRVFVNGWAFEVTATGIERNLRDLTIHLLPVAGDNEGVYDRHGYDQSFRTQIVHGIIDYCGARRGVTEFVFDSESEDAAATAQSVERAVRSVRDAIRASPAARDQAAPVL